MGRRAAGQTRSSMSLLYCSSPRGHGSEQNVLRPDGSPQACARILWQPTGVSNSSGNGDGAGSPRTGTSRRAAACRTGADARIAREAFAVDVHRSPAHPRGPAQPCCYCSWSGSGHAAAPIGQRQRDPNAGTSEGSTCAQNPVNISRRAARLLEVPDVARRALTSDGRCFRRTAGRKHRDAGAASVPGAEVRFEKTGPPHVRLCARTPRAENVVVLLRLHAQPAASRKTMPKPGAGTAARRAGRTWQDQTRRGRL